MIYLKSISVIICIHPGLTVAVSLCLRVSVANFFRS
jgi:hypothetical protein